MLWKRYHISSWDVLTIGFTWIPDMLRVPATAAQNTHAESAAAISIQRGEIPQPRCLISGPLAQFPAHTQGHPSTGRKIQSARAPETRRRSRPNRVYLMP
mgnify:CR=1 FL=1|jgi:hypothetical protein